MHKIKVAINGFGRIGRAFLKLVTEYHNHDIEIVAVNDLGDINNLAYLLKYDSAQGRAWQNKDIKVHSEDNILEIEGHKINFLQIKDPTMLPWKNLDIDIVIESTGIFDDFEKAKMHITAGAKRVVISAPGKGQVDFETVGGTILMGVNEDLLDSCQLSSNGSCTTNAASPVVSILDEAIGIEKAILNTVHAYTATQMIVDGPGGKDYRRGRAAAQNIVPASTGAAVAVTEALTHLKGKFDGISLRVPVIAGSIADITFIAKRKTSVEEINQILKDASRAPRWQNIFTVTEDQVVSSDIVGSRFASIADLTTTKVVDGDLVKVMAWYDNEMGYTQTLIEHTIKAGKNLIS